MIKKHFSSFQKFLGCIELRLRLMTVVLFIFLLLSSFLCGCHVDEVINSSDFQRESNNSSRSLQSEPNPPRAEELPDYKIHVTAVPETIQARWYCPGVDRVFEILLPNQNASDYRKTTEQSVEKYGPGIFTCYENDTTSFEMKTTGDFSFHRNKKTSDDIDRVWPRGLSPFRPQGSRQGSNGIFLLPEGRLLFNDNEISVMPKADAAELAQATMKRLGYENILLLDVTALRSDKILKKTLEWKHFDEEYKKTHPEYPMYDYRLDWKEEDGKYIVVFLVTAPDGIPVYDMPDDADEVAMTTRAGSLCEVMVGKDGVEDMYVRAFCCFDGLPQSKATIKNTEDMEALLEDYYAMNPTVLAHGLQKIRLIYLPEAYSLQAPLPDVLSFTPTYICHVWEDLGKRDENNKPLLTLSELYFNAISGAQIKLR